MIEAMSLDNILSERTAHDQPHDQLDPFGTRFPHVLNMTNLPKDVRVAGHAVKEGVIKR
jgi:hypothetical protein